MDEPAVETLRTRIDGEVITALVAEGLAADRVWARERFHALEPHLLGDGTYVNVLPDNDEVHLSRSYGSKYPRLQQIKGRYDPDNVFHGNANIRPLVTTP